MIFYFLKLKIDTYSAYRYLILRCIIIVKKVLRGWKCRIQFLRLKSAIVALQCCLRIFMAKKVLQTLRYVATVVKVQSWCRVIGPRNVFLRKREKSLTISSWARMVIQRRKYFAMVRSILESRNLALQVEVLRSRLLEESEMRIQTEKVCQRFSQSLVPFLARWIAV